MKYSSYIWYMKRIYYNTETTTTVKKKAWIDIDTDFTQLYDCFSGIAPLIHSATSFKLMFWLLANEASKYNGIRSSADVHRRFNEHLALHEQSITYRTFQNCIDELLQAKAINKVARGVYYFNPYIFWKDTIEERKGFIELEKKDGMQSYNPKQLPAPKAKIDISVSEPNWILIEETEKVV